MAKIQQIVVTIRVTREEAEWIKKWLRLFKHNREDAFTMLNLGFCSAARPSSSFWYLEGHLDRIRADTIIFTVDDEE